MVTPGGTATRLLIIVLTVTAMISPLWAQQLIATVPVPAAQGSYSIATNSVTKKVYVADHYSDDVAVIDEASLSTTLITVAGPFYIAVNEVTNKIYASGFSNVTVIDGATNQTATINFNAGWVAVNPVTNKIYVDALGYGIAVVDGATLSYTIVPISGSVGQIVVNQETNKIYVATDNSGGSVVVIDGATNSTTSVTTFGYPGSMAVDTYTNKIYLGTYDGVTIIEGATLSVTSVVLGLTWGGNVVIDINPRTNKIYAGYATSQYTSYLTTIDGTTLSTSTISLGPQVPTGLVVEPISNKIYVIYQDYGLNDGLLVINGMTERVSTVFTGYTPSGLAVDSATDRIYVLNPDQQFVWVVAGPSPFQFVPVSPCRVVDTRRPDGTLGGPPIQGGTYRSFPLGQGACNIASNAAAYSLNVTVVPQTPLGYLTVWPSGQSQPVVSTMNSVDGRVKANAAIVPAGVGGAVSVYASDTTNVILDINGYYEQATNSALSFYPVAPCRVADTRSSNGALGGPYLIGNQERDFPILASNCEIPASAQAYSFNITALPHGGLGYLTVWPEGQLQPVVSTLNATTGTVTANAAIVPAGTDGGVAVFPTDDTDLLIDVNGYFAPPGPGGMSLYTVQPCRALDTRQTRGAFSGTILIDLIDSGCGLDDAQAFVLNATVVPQGPLGYLALWPTTQFQPPTSVLNARDGAITSNMVIVTSIDGWLDAFASDPTQLILDGFSYFAP